MWVICMPNIRVHKDVYEKLKEMKNRLKHSSMNETIKYLIDAATSPKGFLEAAIFFLEDIRSDMKKLISILEEVSKLK